MMDIEAYKKVDEMYKFLNLSIFTEDEIDNVTDKAKRMFCDQKGSCDTCECKCNEVKYVSEHKCPICRKNLTITTLCRNNLFNFARFSAGCYDCGLIMMNEASTHHPRESYDEYKDYLFKQTLDMVEHYICMDDCVDNYKKYRLWCIANNIEPKLFKDWYVCHNSTVRREYIDLDHNLNQYMALANVYDKTHFLDVRCKELFDIDG